MTSFDIDDLNELFAAFGPVRVRRMFGGAGIYADGVMFALVADGIVYLKAGPSNASDFDREALEPFSYTTSGGRRGVMSYRRMPDRLYDDPDELAVWAHAALHAALVGIETKASRGKSTPRVDTRKRNSKRKKK